MEFTLPPDMRTLVQIPAGVGRAAPSSPRSNPNAAAVADPSPNHSDEGRRATKWLKLQSRTYVDAFGGTCAWTSSGGARGRRAPPTACGGRAAARRRRQNGARHPSSAPIPAARRRAHAGTARRHHRRRRDGAAVRSELKEEGFVGAAQLLAADRAVARLSDELVHVVVEIDLAAAPNPRSRFSRRASGRWWCASWPTSSPRWAKRVQGRRRVFRPLSAARAVSRHRCI